MSGPERRSWFFAFGERGVSLLELIPAIAIASLIVAGFTIFYLSEQRNFQHGRAAVEAGQDLRTALDQMIRDLRMASRNPKDVTPCGFTVASATEVQFTFDGDDNGVCGETAKGELRGFRRNPATPSVLESLVAPGSVAPWETLASGLATNVPIFSYLRIDGAGNLVEIPTLPATAAERATIARVDVRLRLSRKAPIGGVVREEAASALVRNRAL